MIRNLIFSFSFSLSLIFGIGLINISFSQDEQIPDEGCQDLPGPGQQAIDNALRLPAPPENVTIVSEEVGKVERTQVRLYRAGDEEELKLNFELMLQVLAKEARETFAGKYRAIEELTPRDIDPADAAGITLYIFAYYEDILVRLSNSQKKTLAALCMVLLDNQRVVLKSENSWGQNRVRQLALMVLGGLANRSFGNFPPYFYNGEVGEKQKRHAARCYRDWHRWWSVAVEAEISDWDTVGLPSIPEGVETELDAKEREEERIQREKDEERWRYYEVRFAVERGLQKVRDLTSQEKLDFEKAEAGLAQAKEEIKKLSQIIEEGPEEEKEERNYILNNLKFNLEEAELLLKSFKNPCKSLDDVKEAEQLLGMVVYVPEAVRLAPGKEWDMVLDMMKEYGMIDPKTGEEVKGDAVIPLFKKQYGERPENIPAPKDNDTRMKTEQLQKFAEENLGATDGVRVWWPGSVGITDYWEKRLNIHINQYGRIYRIAWN